MHDICIGLCLQVGRERERDSTGTWYLDHSYRDPGTTRSRTIIIPMVSGSRHDVLETDQE